MTTDRLGLIFLAIGGVSAIVAVLLFLRTRRFMSSAVSVQGMVTEMVERHGSEGGTTYSPVVQFTTVEGQSLTFTEMVSQSPPKYSLGENVKVMYPPGNPQAARIPSWFRLWFLSSFSALFAVVFLGIGVPMYLSASDSEQEPLSLPGGITIPSPVTSLPPGLIPIPTDLPSPGPILVIQDGSGTPRPVAATCESVRELRGGKARQVQLRYEGGRLSFRASPYTGPGPYTPGTNLEVGGTVFEPGANLSGAVVFDPSGQAGAINLVAGSRLASGAWDCSGVAKS